MQPTLASLDIANFRSIRGQIHAPLDAKVVLVHGENGAGKTSLLSAIELALTGRIQSFERADPGYGKQLLYRSAVEGYVRVRTSTGTDEQTFEALLTDAGAASVAALAQAEAAFFRERVFLPQSLLGQLLQIYQDAKNEASSPLSQFVGRLLALDRLDALELGLRQLNDVRNVRKVVDGWAIAETEKNRSDRLLADQRKLKDVANGEIRAGIEALATACTVLELTIGVGEDNLDDVAAALSVNSDDVAFARLTDEQRQLAAIRREIDAAQATSGAEPEVSFSDEDSASAFAQWESANSVRIEDARTRAEALLPDSALPTDPEHLAGSTLDRLRAERDQFTTWVVQAREELRRYTAALDERDVAERQRDTVDIEINRLSATPGSLGTALSELTSYVVDEICPVCDRDFSEVNSTPLSEHLHAKVRTLSASAERLLTLGQTRGEAQRNLERLEREIATISARRLDEEAIAALDRRLAAAGALVGTLEGLSATLMEGARLRAADIAARRRVSEAQTRHTALAAARDTLNDFALSIDAAGVANGESFGVAAARLDEQLKAEASRLEKRLTLRRSGKDLITSVRSGLTRRAEAEQQIFVDFAAWQNADRALDRAQALRDQGNAIRNAVDRVRSSIIRREFNDRLNRVWRDLFVRLAPAEPFVPAFRIPPSSTQKLQPKLITEHRDGGDAGGTPGAMLSSGNLNTAALTLFVALHLSVPKTLPWLILDDPVQSMDDVHVSHFAAVLRTLSKEQGRQVVIAVHDRQLFEYLKLELSPAFPEDSLLTLELSRGPRRDSLCVSRRFSFKEETVFLAAA